MLASTRRCVAVQPSARPYKTSNSPTSSRGTWRRSAVRSARRSRRRIHDAPSRPARGGRRRSPRSPRPRRPRRRPPTPGCSSTWPAPRSSRPRSGAGRGAPLPARLIGSPGPLASARSRGARRRRGGLPRLQREQRPAVRADARAQGRRAERRAARRRQRGARGRLPDRHRDRISPVPLPGGDAGAQLIAEARHVRGPIPPTRPIIRPRSALGPEVRRARARRARRRRCPTARRCAVASASASVELDDFFSTFDEKTRANVDRNLDEPRRRARRPRQRPQPHAPALPQLFGHLTPVIAHARRRRTPTSRASSTSSAHRARARAAVRARNAHLFTTMADTFGALSRDPQALQDTIAETPPTLDGEHRVAARAAPVPRPHRGVLARPHARRRASSAPPAAGQPRARDGHARAAPHAALTDELQGTLRACADLAKSPTTNIALRGLARRSAR